MRRMTIEEQRKLIEVLVRQEFGASMERVDAVCYGSIASVEKYRDIDEHLIRVIKAIPSDIRKDWDREQRKAQADQLRAKADLIEAGKDEIAAETRSCG